MITIIFAPPRTGKTCYMTHLANERAFDKQRSLAMKKEILSKRANGFVNLQTIPKHCVSANYDMTFHKFGYSPRFSRLINPYRLGFYNKFVETHFTLPFETICITEAQKYLNSRMSMYFPDWQSRWYEQHGHNDLDILLDTQRPMLIDVNIRELSEFVEIVNMRVIYDKFSKVSGLKWTVRHIQNCSLFDRYMASGKKDESCYTESAVEASYNVFNSYDSQSCKPKFYDGHLSADFDYTVAEPKEETLQGYIKYLEMCDDELPKNFYNRRKSK